VKLTLLPLDKSDRNITILLISAIAITSLVWVGDIFSWAWVGNGFLLDIIFLFVAIVLTLGLVFLVKKIGRENAGPEIAAADQPTIFCCLNCGALLESSDECCPSCGTPLPVCAVCFSPFKRSEVIVQLPCCGSYGHKEHVLNYFDIKGLCPKCLQPFDPEELVNINIE